MSKFNIAQVEAVKAAAVEAGAKLRIRYYANGKECAKDAAVEFTYTVTNGVSFEVVSVEEDAPEVTEVRIKGTRTPPAQRKGQPTKAMKLREYIEESRAAGNFDVSDAVNWAVAALGFRKPLARVYVKNLSA